MLEQHDRTPERQVHLALNGGGVAEPSLGCLIVTGTGGDARFYQDFFGDTIERETDLTFTLTGKTGKAASVPDSGVTLLYSGLAMAALALVRRRLAS